MTLSHIFYTLQPYYANCIFPHWPIQRDNKDKSIIIINTKITFPYPCFCLLRLLGFTESRAFSYVQDIHNTCICCSHAS